MSDRAENARETAPNYGVLAKQNPEPMGLAEARASAELQGEGSPGVEQVWGSNPSLGSLGSLYRLPLGSGKTLEIMSKVPHLVLDLAEVELGALRPHRALALYRAVGSGPAVALA